MRVDDLAHALPELAVVVDPGESEVGERQITKGGGGLLGRDASLRHPPEQGSNASFERRVAVEDFGLADRRSPLAHGQHDSPLEVRRTMEAV